MLQEFPMYAHIPAKDLSRARQFYEQKVGLKAKKETAGTSRARGKNLSRSFPSLGPERFQGYIAASEQFQIPGFFHWVLSRGRPRRAWMIDAIPRFD